MANGVDQTLHEQLTQLLMDNGAAVTKTSIDALIQFIGIRDQSIIHELIRNSEGMLSRLQRNTDVRE